MKILDYLKRTIKITNIILSVSYCIFKYKLNFITYNDAVVATCNTLVKNSYLFIKIIQWGIQDIRDFNIQHNEKLIHYFNNFSNNVPYTLFELQHAILCIKKSIEYAITCNDELIIENNFIPVNSGSVALVFKAHLNNKPVIIKILRHNIKNIIEEDICVLLHFFDNIFIKKIIYYYIKVDFKIFIQNNYDTFLNQCDFIHETNCALLFKNNLKNKKKIIIPHVYKHFTDAFHELIVMDYLDGPVAKNVTLTQINNHHSEIMQSFFFESLFLYQILHGDFHLGNVIIINDNTIGIIDFGITYTISNEVSNYLFDILILNMNKKCASHLNKLQNNLIKLICSNKSKHEEIFKQLKNDNELDKILINTKFSPKTIVIWINKILSLKNIEISKPICNTILATMSGLQTLERFTDTCSLSELTKSIIQKI